MFSPYSGIVRFLLKKQYPQKINVPTYNLQKFCFSFEKHGEDLQEHSYSQKGNFDWEEKCE